MQVPQSSLYICDNNPFLRPHVVSIESRSFLRSFPEAEGGAAALGSCGKRL